MKIQVSLSAETFTFHYTIGLHKGTVRANTVKLALSQARKAWAANGRLTHSGAQGRGKTLADTDIALVCPAASDEAIKVLQREIHVLVTEECRPATAQRERLSKLLDIQRELQARR